MLRGAGAALASALLVSTAVRPVHAQTDVAPPLPNILILLDTSGSMERLPDGTVPAVPTATVSTTIKNRWVQALEVLGGNIKNYKLLSVQRNSSDFKGEYSLGITDPYDFGYYLNHYRAFSNNCTLGPNASKTWPLSWTTWGVNDFGWRPLSGTTMGAIQAGDATCGPTVYQTDGVGILDTFRDQARFALMTFDSDPDPSTGWTSGAHDNAGGIKGLWSYYPNWNSTTGGAAPAYGWPQTCAVDSTTLSQHLYEVGARNPSAPPWEGPLVPFAADDSTTALRAVNDRIKYAVRAIRPFGATPVSPMFADAAYYLTQDPTGPSSTTADALGSCRGTFIILITDGFPNEDLRPSCQSIPGDPKGSAVWPSCVTTGGGTGCCPSKRSQDIAWDLSHPAPGVAAVKTFVVGFALSNDAGTPLDCSTVDPSTSFCSSLAANDPLQACCTVNQIAFNGGTTKALLASDSDTLRAALIKALSEATASAATSRTLPVFAASSTTSGNGQFEFRSSFKPNPFGAWNGKLERVRWQCVPVSGQLTPQEQAFDPAQGDDFAKNLNTTTSREFHSWDGVTGTTRASSDSIRPLLANSDVDGVEHTVGTALDGTGAAFVSAVPAAAMGMTATSCTDTAIADECKQKNLNFALGQPQPKSAWLSRVGNAFGDIYHATPVAVGPPNSFIRDESYVDFRNNHLTRPLVLFAATNDGLLHAFRTDVTTSTQNELWAFVPPAVLTAIPSTYGGAHALLLDQAAVVKDVPFGTGTILYGRTQAAARAGSAQWHTMLLEGLTTGRGYFALDVTEVGNADLTKAKPKFAWQLSTIVDRNLFGNYPAVPAIGTVYYKEVGAAQAVETPVAFLPGGEGTLFNAGSCPRWPRPSGVTLPSDARTSVRCWTGPGQSMTVVRLFDGKVIRSFRNDPLGIPGTRPAETSTSPVPLFIAAGRSDVVQDLGGAYATIDSPITGAVSIFPGTVGAVSTRAFVGDADGGLWKLDVSNTDPQKWTFTLFHDAYIAPDNNALIGQPLAVPPVLSVDKNGEINVNYATGDQSNFSASSVNHVYSITEHITGGATPTATPVVNWHLRFPGGVTTTGPLSLFNGTLYFSTFTPGVDTGSVCLKGQGTLWGVDFHDTEPGTTALPLGKFKRLPTEPTTVGDGSCPDSTGHALVTNRDARIGFEDFFRCVALPPGSIVFGAGITQRPSCVSTPASSIGIDPYTGMSSSHMQVSGISQGDFHLVAQTGPKAGTSTTTATNTFIRTLQSPMPVSRIDSWAAVVE